MKKGKRNEIKKAGNKFGINIENKHGENPWELMYWGWGGGVILHGECSDTSFFTFSKNK